MKKIILLCFSTILILSCKSKIVILGEKISQKDICLDLGYGNKCNPFPYGDSFFMNRQRASIPIKENDTTNTKINELLSNFIGGKLVNGTLITPHQIDLKNEWFYTHLPIKLDQKFLKKTDVKIEIPLNEILEIVLASESLNASEKQVAKDKIENSFNRFSESKGTLELFYHSVNLSGNWYNEVLNGDIDAKSILTYNRKCIENESVNGKCEKYSYENEINDNYKFVGGIGAIEYKITKLDSLKSSIKSELQSNFGIPIAENLSAKFKNEVERTVKISAPRRLDIVFVSTLKRKFFIDVK